MPTENRPSNTETVSVPPFIGIKPLVGRYYPARCRRCGWVGSSEELTEDEAQCTRDAGDRLCLGDCDELGCDDLLRIIQAMSMSAQQHQGEPIAWMVGSAIWWSKPEAEVDAKLVGEPVIPIGPLADAGEVERLRLEIEQLRFSLEAHDHESVQDDCARAENRTLSAEVERLRTDLAEMTKSYEALGAVYAGTQKGFERLQAQLAERDALLGDALQDSLDIEALRMMRGSVYINRLSDRIKAALGRKS